jgi:hypothetical protein
VTGRRFDVSEVGGAGTGDAPPSDAELADALAIARELESLASSDHSGPSSGFDDRVMAAIAGEAPPRFVVRPSSTGRAGVIGGLLLTVRQAWRVAFSGGRPLAVRAQAFALVAVVLLAAGLLTTATAVTVGGLLQARSTPAPSVAPAPTFPTTGPTVGPSVPPSSEPTPSPTETAEPTDTAEPTETAEPGETARPTSADGGSGDGGGSIRTPEPGHTAEPTDGHSGGGSDGSDGGSGPSATDDHGGTSGGSGSDGGGSSGGSGPD